MKNLLAEAARSAIDAEAAESLSNSGSFDTTLQNFDSTANDEAALGDAADPAIAPEPEHLALEEDQPQWDALDNVDVADTTSASSSNTPEIAAPAASQMPAFVRLSPYYCVVLALASAGIWQFYSAVTVSRDVAALGATLVQSPQEYPAPHDTRISVAERFPYIQGVDEPVVDSQ